MNRTRSCCPLDRLLDLNRCTAGYRIRTTAANYSCRRKRKSLRDEFSNSLSAPALIFRTFTKTHFPSAREEKWGPDSKFWNDFLQVECQTGISLKMRQSKAIGVIRPGVVRHKNAEAASVCRSHGSNQEQIKASQHTLPSRSPYAESAIAKSCVSILNVLQHR